MSERARADGAAEAARDASVGNADDGSSIGAFANVITEISERATLLVREEIELAKAEVTRKVGGLIRGAVVTIVAGVFFLTALVFALIGCAWLLYYFLPGTDYTFFWGFFAMAAILLALGVAAGFVAARLVKRSAPPVPKMAMDEARKIRETVSTQAEPDQPPADPSVADQPPVGDRAPAADRSPSADAGAAS